MRWHVEGTYNPSDRGSSKTGEHMVLDEPLQFGRLVRAAGDPLCKPARKFWGLTGRRQNSVITCHQCVKQALRIGVDFEAKPALDLGRSWWAILVIEGGRPRRIDLRSRWFLVPPVAPPSPPGEQRMLLAVQAFAPLVRSVRIDRLEPTGYNEVSGMAIVETNETTPIMTARDER